MNRIFINIIISVLLIAFSSCSKSLKEIIKETEDATFTVYTYDGFGRPMGSGSGFFISEDGIGITNYHVLDGAVKATLKTSGGEEFVINQVLASDENWDIVKFDIKKTMAQKFSYLKFAKKTVTTGDKVYNISSPLGLESTVSEGIVSSIRTDGQHGDIIQITAPISPGSSGSALLNDRGQVFAVATFNRSGGQNLNFGVAINQERLNNLVKNDFVKKNIKFNSNDNFIIINKSSEKGADVVLNAIELTESATIGYFTYTNLQLAYGSEMVIWNEIEPDEKGYRFTIEDIDTNRKYYIQSSTIGRTKEKGTKVSLASSYTFKVFFSPMAKHTKHINIYNGNDTRSWVFSNIDLDEYRNIVNIDKNKHIKEYAYSLLYLEGGLQDSENVLLAYLEDNPTDVEALNALGIISAVKDNKSDAISFFSKAIEYEPTKPNGYFNRFAIYQEQGDTQNALADVNQTIQCDPAQPDYYLYRGNLYLILEEYEQAEKDFNHLIESNDFKKEALPYLYRAACKMAQKRFREACDDIYKAYNLTSDKELEDTLQEMWKDCGC